MVSTEELVAFQRSAAMVGPGQTLPLRRETVTELCTELLELRALVARVGSGLRDVAQRSRTMEPATPRPMPT